MNLELQQKAIRAQVMGLEGLEEYARELAAGDRVVMQPGAGHGLNSRLEENRRALAQAQEEFSRALARNETLPQAAEWLLDNFYIVQEQIQQVRRDLSPHYYRELPRLADGDYKGYPRVYGLAFELIAHTDSHLDAASLENFVRAYQKVVTLTSGELWAIPIMLRFGLVENLRRLIDEALQVLSEREEADRWGDRLLAVCKRPATEIVVALADLARVHQPLEPAFTLRLLQRLHDQDPAIAPAIHWLETRMEEEGDSVESFIHEENQRRTVTRVSVGNVITSMRFLDALDWPRFFDDTSIVEGILSDDPGGIYSRMDLRTRDSYRHAVEQLSRYSKLSEAQVAEAAVGLARRARDAGARAREAHVGYYLVDKGIRQLEQATGYHPSPRRIATTWVFAHPTLFYLGLIGLLTTAFLTAVIDYALQAGANPAQLLLAALLALFPLSALAVGMVNWTITVESVTNTPPKLDLQGGIPAEHRTMVVVPALVSSLAGVEFLLQNLERRFLANRDENLHFALLGDLADAPREQMPEDQELIEALTQGCRELNEKYDRADAFYLFVRRRTWSPGEAAWMGWERKRGKLIEFNRLLRGARNTTFAVQIGDVSILPRVRYVLTLDADTELPLSVARKMVGAMAHPLNRPVLAPDGHVVEGYGIIQPRVDVIAPAAVRSLFAQIFTGDTGLDPYSTVISNIYQDLFKTSVFIGKGIYDVDAALAALGSRFPENAVLSHDLVEGAFARTGLASDIELLEDFPSSYDAFALRQHRWMRGDWQIAEWLGPRVKNAAGEIYPNPLPSIDRWKIFDNLRRSLVQPFALLLLIAGWMVLPGSPVIWTALALFTIAFPFVRSILAGLGVRPRGERLGHYFVAVSSESRTAVLRALLTIAFLMFQATFNLDAIVRALVRGYVTHKRLLEWTIQSKAERDHAQTPADFIRRMWASPLLALALAVGLALWAPAALPLAAPLVALWIVSPLLAFYISRPFEHAEKPLPDSARRELTVIARRIWGYYERFAGAEDHWLPPDNFEVEPKAQIAHRTSPTNIGFLILSTIAAYDFGFIDRCAMVDRLEHVLATLQQLERYRGHFLNWYDTRTLRPLYPEYVSTVDSGNLAACLIVLEQMCEELTSGEPARAAPHAGLAEVAAVLDGTLRNLNGDEKKALPVLPQMQDAVTQIQAALAQDHTPQESGAEVAGLTKRLNTLSGRIPAQAPGQADLQFWVARLAEQVERWHDGSSDGGCAGDEMESRLKRIGVRARMFLAAMDFSFLFSESRGVFAVGFNVTDNRLDNSYYDMLASEERLTSFIAIANGQVPEKHWFRLSRPLTRAAGQVALLSWGGTMFEYLMPPLLLQDYPNTLLSETMRAVVQRQIQYAAERGVPWGISESGFYAFDYQFNYQYRLFGVPDLGLKREATDNLVIAPYATFLALPFAPQAAWANLQALAQAGAEGDLGYYEALDYTADRAPAGARAGIVRQYMAHHQGMSLVALDNYLNGDPMHRRFHNDPALAAIQVLLQERIPHHTPFIQTTKEDKPVLRSAEETRGPTTRQFATPFTPVPRAQILSNGEYSVAITNAGGGYSVYRDVDITRWREDRTRDDWGSFIYIRNVGSGETWSATFQPTGRQPEQYRVQDALDRVEFRRRDQDIECKTEIVVAPQNNVEIRRLTLTNHNFAGRTLELTSYAEVVLDSHRPDAAHPAFSKLFVESEFDSQHGALLFKRRPRSSGQPALWAFHLLASSERGMQVREYETDRARFLGHGSSPADPAGLAGPLSNTVGATLDPIMSLRARVRLRAGEAITLAFVTGAAGSREQAVDLCAQFSELREIERTFELAGVHSQVQLRHLGIAPEEAFLFQRLASRVLYGERIFQAPEELRAKNIKGQSGLWPYGISGDYPIVLVKIASADDLGLVRQALLAHEYWRMNNFRTDLVILNEHPATYAEGVQGRVQDAINTSLSHPWLDKPGGVFLRRRDHIAPEDFILLQTVARVILDASLGQLDVQLERSRPASVRAAPARPPRPTGGGSPAAQPRAATPARLLDNGLGAFSPDGREYIITLAGNQWTPRPWINVLANPDFGCLVSESGLGFAWYGNSQQNALTPWSNDPVSDPPSQILYLSDEESHQTWSPSPLPIREPEPYTVHHGAGYSRFEHESHGIAQELTVLVAQGDPIEIVRLRLSNRAGHARHLRATFYVPWVCGTTRESAVSTIVTEPGPDGILLARNTYNADFNTRLAFAAASERITGFTSDRTEFLGRNGIETHPAALAPGAPALSGRASASSDPCAVLQARVDLAPGEDEVIYFYLGQGGDPEQAQELVRRYREPGRADKELAALGAEWDRLLNAVQVNTPDQELNLLLNHWLLYQVLACRLRARSAFYQSGGAYGFRDQLQDVMALAWSAPGLAREQILRAAAHQFAEGDVMHWWHPPADRGVRTRISDDPLWLPFVADYYVRATEDTGILDEQAPFIKMPALAPGQSDMYGEPENAGESGSLYEHCLRALDHSLRFGANGLPLMGTGDWNDGMNQVGEKGQGESVWLGWFLYANLVSFAAICETRGDTEHAARYREQAQTLQKALEEGGWDGEWYRRAFFDDGTPLGSSQNPEGKIDAIAQAWAVISGAASDERGKTALAAVEQHLVKEQDQMVLLLTPPFDTMQPDPGYIEGYIPGTRENGGQYTHGAMWVVLAYLRRGDGDRAAALLSLLNPLHHTRNAGEVQRYRAEPYVIAADVYSHPQHIGEGGWTWYTGSAAWMYRIAVEEMLGLKRRGGKLVIDPCIPHSWPQFEATIRLGSAQWQIRVENPNAVSRGVKQAELDGKPLESADIPLTQDGQSHSVRVVLG